MEKKVHVIISGRVQGVWFRANTKDQAEIRGITGWVKNTSDGNVEAVFQGPTEKVDDLIKWCNKGPPLSNVNNVKIEPYTETETFENFSIKY